MIGFANGTSHNLFIEFDFDRFKALDFDAANGPAANAESLRYALDMAAELPVEFGNVGQSI